MRMNVWKKGENRPYEKRNHFDIKMDSWFNNWYDSCENYEQIGLKLQVCISRTDWEMAHQKATWPSRALPVHHGSIFL